MLQTTPVSALRGLSFPFAGEAGDVFTLKTATGTGYIDQGSGALLGWADHSLWARVSETLYMLHTGQGAAAFGLLLGLMAFSVPLMGASGVLIWAAGRRGHVRIKNSSAAGKASTIVLVASEGGSTWGFAASLARKLQDAGQSVHVAPLSGFAPHRYGRAQRVLVLAATYGEGAAPASAKGVLDRLAALQQAPEIPLAVLGFGDRSFPAFCGFAQAIADLAEVKGWAQILPMGTVDRQSAEDFAAWGRALGQAMGMPLDLDHQPARPASQALTLVSRRDYGIEVQAPTAILRFARPTPSLWQRMTGGGFARYHPGDLIGILPEGATRPRFYSLASCHRDGFVEIVVKKHPGGLCSGQLVTLEPGQSVTGFLRRTPVGQPKRGKQPLILIGAGTGIAPLAGFLRANRGRRAMHLFFGLRHPKSDFLYQPELAQWQAEGRLACLTPAISRAAHPVYVQDALRREASEVTRLIRSGARVMVCGGRDMAGGVAEAMTEILAPPGTDTGQFESRGTLCRRYLLIATR